MVTCIVEYILNVIDKVMNINGYVYSGIYPKCFRLSLSLLCNKRNKDLTYRLTQKNEIMD